MGARRVVNVQEAKTHLSRLLRQVEAGDDIAIARDGRVVARLVRSSEGRRSWGVFEGQVRAAPDAFDPLDDDEASRWVDGGWTPA